MGRNFEIRDASRKNVWLKMGLAGPAGAGKTKSSLLMARGLCDRWEEIVVIDSENTSSEEYVDELCNGDNTGVYKTLPFNPPFNYNEYCEAIEKVVSYNKFKVIVCDSISHIWAGSGGLLSKANELGATSRDGGRGAWRQVDPMYMRFVESIKQAPIHIITTMRAKSDFGKNKTEDDKQTTQRFLTNIVMRDGFEYELSALLLMTRTQNGVRAIVDKKRSLPFPENEPFIPSIKFGQEIRSWLESGEGSILEADNTINELMDKLAFTVGQRQKAREKYPDRVELLEKLQGKIAETKQ